MKTLIWFTVLMPLLALGAENAEVKKFNDAFSVAFPEGFPEWIKAGETKVVKVKFTVKDEKVLTPFYRIVVKADLANGLPGSRRIVQAFVIRNQFKKIDFVKDGELKIETTAFMSGYYRLDFTLQFMKDDDVLHADLTNAPAARTAVINDPAQADIEPPIVTSLAFEKNDLGQDGELKVRFKVADKNPLCTKDLYSAKKCRLVRHIAFAEEGKTIILNDYEGDVEWDAAAKQYFIRVKLPTKKESGDPAFVKGRYRILGINLADLAGNEVHELPPSLQKEFKIQ